MATPTSRVCNVKVTGPLAPFADAYLQELKECGYASLTVGGKLRQLERLSRWLEVRGVTAGSLTRAMLDEFAAEQRALGYVAYCRRPGLIALFDVLRGLGVLEHEPEPPGSRAEELLASFGRYLLSERGLGARTAEAYVAYARRFLEGLGDDPVLAGLTAGEVTQAVLRESERVSAGSAQYFVAALRSFLRFCLIEGLLGSDLSQAALTVGGRRRDSLPKRIGRSDAKALLSSCDRRQVVGRRDLAVILMLLRLGLRAFEVAQLRLDEINWRAGEILIRGKGGRCDGMPVPVDVGEAIASYLDRGRPPSDRREVFLRARAPIGPLQASGISTIVRRACRRAGIQPVGAHRLRHTAACEMIASGVPLGQIGQVLRHRSSASTAIYARVDLERLRQLARPWPVQEGPR